jgi:hypothetical protein
MTVRLVGCRVMTGSWATNLNYASSPADIEPFGTVTPYLEQFLVQMQYTGRLLIERSAASYTCYAQRTGPTAPRLSICLGFKAPA